MKLKMTMIAGLLALVAMLLIASNTASAAPSEKPTVKTSVRKLSKAEKLAAEEARVAAEKTAKVKKKAEDLAARVVYVENFLTTNRCGKAFIAEAIIWCKFQPWGKDENDSQSKFESMLHLGLSQAAMSWCEQILPPKINLTVTASGKHEQCVYEIGGHKFYLYFDNDILTGWQSSSR